MAEVLTVLYLCSLANLVLVMTNALVNSNGLTLQLIPPHSPDSPFFQSNISSEERIKKLVSQSNIRVHHLTETSSSMMRLRAQVELQEHRYMVKIGIGTFKSKPPYKEYYLVPDTGSSLVWMQCEGCTKCFKQTPKPFPKQHSSSFEALNNPSKYKYGYADNTTTHGILARETFYLGNDKGGLSKIEEIQFGCGLENNMPYGKTKNNKIAGILGLGAEEVSFPMQLGTRIQGRFSYCLPPITTKARYTYLRFGDDIIKTSNSQSTPLHILKADSNYYVDLQGISINHSKLKINPSVFNLNSTDGTGGSVLDSGTPFSRIISPAFDALKLGMENYFSGFKDLTKIGGNLGLELCYQRKSAQGFSKLPSVTFHLRGTQSGLVMKPEAVFQVVKRCVPVRCREYFCLAMLRSKTQQTLIGSMQQTNQMMIHDLKNKRLVFYERDCSKNP